MITDSQTNKLYLADCLPEKQPAFYSRFKSVLEKCNILPEFLPNTKDIWVKDYMPIQIDTNSFVQFVYNPDYLQSKSGQTTFDATSGINFYRHHGLASIKPEILSMGLR